MIEHTLGVYLGLLLIATLVAVVAEKISGLPYTIALVLVGLAVGLVGGLNPEDEGFGRELVFFVLLPPLLFQGALHMELSHLLDHLWPIFVFAILGVVISTAVIGAMVFLVGATGGFLVALLFGSILCATDPVSVLAIFKQAGVSAGLRHLVEGESLFNDGTSVVVFTILLGLVQHGGAVEPLGAVLQFVKVAGGGLVLGGLLGYVTYLFIRSMDEPLIETAACLILALGSFWVAEVIHLSGVIACVTAGLLVGNHGRHLSMSPKVTLTVENFFEVLDFIINSLLFLMIGLEMQVIGAGQWVEHLPLLGMGILALLVSRAVTVYPCYHALNLVGRQRPTAWAHILFWGGLRGSIPIALLLGLPRTGPIAEYREALIVAGFGVVIFSLVVQGLTVKPLVAWLKLDEAGQAASSK